MICSITAGLVFYIRVGGSSVASQHNHMETTPWCHEREKEQTMGQSTLETQQGYAVCPISIFFFFFFTLSRFIVLMNF